MTDAVASRENRLAEAFVALADNLVSGFDVADLFHELATSCLDLLDATAAGLMLVGGDGRLRVMASSSERSRLLELMEIQHAEGPCLDAHGTGQAVVAPDLTEQRGRWPVFSDEALRVGFRSVYALPMRLRNDTIGALNLFHHDLDGLGQPTLRLGQALADVATIAILQQRAIESSDELSNQLQGALNSRVTIEQAKGVLAARLDLDMAAAFEVLRRYARSTQRRLSEVADAVVSGAVDAGRLRPFGPGVAGL